MISQGFENIFDLSNPSDIPLEQSGTGDSKIVISDPTLADLMTEDGVQINVDPGSFLQVSFTVESKIFDPSIEGELIEEDDVLGKVNTAQLFDMTTGTTNTSKKAIYFEDISISDFNYNFYDPNFLGMVIPTLPMTNELNATINQDIKGIEGYISYDTRYFLALRKSDFTVYVNNEEVSNDSLELQTYSQGNQYYTYFTLVKNLKAGDKIKIIINQGTTSYYTDDTAAKTFNSAKLMSSHDETNILFSNYYESI